MTTQPKSLESLIPAAIKVVGIAADHGGHELKKYLARMLCDAGVEVIDFGNLEHVPEDDYPDFVVPLARAVATGEVDRGVAICGSGVGACVVANKVTGVRACLIHDPFSAHQGVEDDDLNLICLGGLVVGHALAWELVWRFLTATFSGKERHRRRLEKVSELETRYFPGFITAGDAARTDSGLSGENTPGQGPTLKIYLVRHGETEWTFSSRHTGLTDLPLTALGEDEVREWGALFCEIPFQQILTSPSQRTRRTCELVGLSEAAEIENDLAEWNYGDYEGLQSHEIRDEREGWNVFRDGCPNGESPAQISARADRLISRLRKMQGNIALFSHSQFGGVLAARWIGLAVEDAQHFPLGTASLGILGSDPHHPEVPVIELWNSSPCEPWRLTPPPCPLEHPSLKQRAMQRWENEGGGNPNTRPNDSSGSAH